MNEYTVRFMMPNFGVGVEKIKANSYEEAGKWFIAVMKSKYGPDVEVTILPERTRPLSNEELAAQEEDTN